MWTQTLSSLANLLLASPEFHGLATHDDAMVAAAKSYAKEHGIDRSHFEFQMLYGIRRDLQRKLVEEGYKVRVYVPFGNDWYPTSCAGWPSVRRTCCFWRRTSSGSRTGPVQAIFVGQAVGTFLPALRIAIEEENHAYISANTSDWPACASRRRLVSG
jgi:hypothetical protein